jgi:nucleoid DNA-binding protein/ribosomal protein L32
MAVPKRRLSGSNTRHRRSTWKAAPSDLTCPITHDSNNTGELMNKRALVETVAADAHLDLASAESALDALVGAVSAALADGDKVVIPGFGTFEVRDRSARTGRNPQTGEAIEIPAGRAAAFKPATALKQAVARS